MICKISPNPSFPKRGIEKTKNYPFDYAKALKNIVFSYSAISAFSAVNRMW